MQESFEAIIDSLILVQDEHAVLVVPEDTGTATNFTCYNFPNSISILLINSLSCSIK